VFVLALLIVGLLMFLTIYVIVRLSGGSVKEGAKLTIAFIISTFEAVQNVVTIGRAAEPGLPPLVRNVYDWFAFLQFQGVTVHPACLAVTTGPFFTVSLQFCIIMPLVLLWLAGMWWGEERRLWKRSTAAVAPLPARGNPHAPENTQALAIARDVPPAVNTGSAAYVVKGRAIVFTLLGMLYATITTQALATVWCVSHDMSVRAYVDLATDGTSLIDSGIPASMPELFACLLDPYSLDCNGKANLLDASMPVTVLSAQPSIVCYEGDHKWAIALAWTILVLYTCLYPLAMYLLLQAWIRKQLRFSVRYELWKAANEAREMRHKEYIDSCHPRLYVCARLRLALCYLPPKHLYKKNKEVEKHQPHMIPIEIVPQPSSASAEETNNKLEASGTDNIAVHKASEAPPVTVTLRQETPPSLASIPEEKPTGEHHRVSFAPDAIEDVQPAFEVQHGVATDLVEANSIIDREDVITHSRVFAPFFDADYRASRFFFSQLGCVMLLALMIIGQAYADTDSDSQDIAQLFLIVLVMCVMLYAYARFQPFKLEETVPKAVELYGVLLCVLEAIVNCVNSIVRRYYASEYLLALATDETLTIDTLPSSPLVIGLQIASYTVVLASIGLFLVIIVGYIFTVLRKTPKYAVFQLRRQSSMRVELWDKKERKQGARTRGKGKA
jgi:hypothetical protein